VHAAGFAITLASHLRGWCQRALAGCGRMPGSGPARFRACLGWRRAGQAPPLQGISRLKSGAALRTSGASAGAVRFGWRGSFFGGGRYVVRV